MIRRRHVPASCIALVCALAATPLLARPIRTNTPGTGVFIGSGLLGQVVCEEARTDAGTLSGCSLVADFRYTPATHWVVGFRVPYVLDRSVSIGGRRTEDSGIGDIEVSGKWRFFRRVGSWFDRHAALEAGIKLPTGDSRLPPAAPPLPLAHRLTPGTGATDTFVDVVFQQGQRRFVWGADLEYRRRGTGENGYRLGDTLSLDVDGEYVLFPRKYERPGKEVFVLLEATLRHRSDDRADTVELPTGGTELLIAPGIQHIATDRFLLSLSVQLPLWQEFEPLGPETTWNVLAEVRYAF